MHSHPYTCVPILQIVGTQELEKSWMPYDLAVFFSSTSSIWSQPGSGHYSSANICLDTMAQKFQHGGVHALSIQYGPFAEVGMASKHVAALVSIGMHPLQPREVSPLHFSVLYFCKY